MMGCIDQMTTEYTAVFWMARVVDWNGTARACFTGSLVEPSCI